MKHGKTQDRATILVTGASGVMGRALIDELAHDYDLICLRHRTPLDDPRVREVAGDLSRPDLGMAASDLRLLTDRVDIVLNNGATTKWTADTGEVTAVNIGGARNVLAFAERAEAPLYHMSTAFVARAEECASAESGPAAYVASKAEAEHMVRDSGIPSVILRPSVVVGDSRDGHIAAFQGIHMMSGAILRNALPVVPADAGSHIDFVPQDLVTTAVRRLLDGGVREGDYWLTAGREALLLTEVVDNTLAVAEWLGLDVHPPRMVPLEALDRLLLPLLEDVMPPGLRKRFRAFAQMMLFFQDAEPFPSDLGRLGLAHAATRETLDKAFTQHNLYWAEANGLTEETRQAVAS
ncbi:SDR family oxidoreductase [Streptomyces sp. NPDC059010]|uniref:SDR family oxidoreductase n=1 Tax=Streptomyces sp. NPDC059010 TaxID=3346695 RepID=UPI0036AE4F0B